MGGQIHAERKRRTPQSHLYWVLECLPGGRMPLQHCAVREKVVHNQLVDFTFIHDGLLKQVWV
jgi:hypothetical protein